MGYIGALLAVAALLVLLHYFTELKRGKKITLASLLVGFILFAWLYNKHQETQRQKLLDVIVRYKQGKTIRCGKYDVNSSLFSLSIGTYTFIGRPNGPYDSILVSAFACD